MNVATPTVGKCLNTQKKQMLIATPRLVNVLILKRNKFLFKFEIKERSTCEVCINIA